MTNPDITPSHTLPPLPDMEDWKSPTILVNGKVLTVDSYLKDAKTYHNSPIPQSYLNSVCQTFQKRLIKEFNLDLPAILKNNESKKEVPNV